MPLKPPLSYRVPLLLCAFISFLYSTQSSAGPNWKAIENAREAKQQANRHISEAEKHHQTSLEKLEAACEKAQADLELSKICDEIISAYKALN